MSVPGRRSVRRPVSFLGQEMARFDLVIFDLDGTLVDSEGISNRVLHRHLAALGVPMTLDEVEAAFIGLSLPSCYQHIADTHGIVIDDAAFTPILQAETFACYETELKPMPGVREALAAITLPKCVASSSERAKIAFSLRLTGLDGFFDDRIFSGREVANPKPAPDVFLHAAGVLGVDPARCAVIEDSRFGIAAGMAAGMTVFAYRPHGDVPDSVRRFDDMAELPGFLF